MSNHTQVSLRVNSSKGLIALQRDDIRPADDSDIMIQYFKQVIPSGPTTHMYVRQDSCELFMWAMEGLEEEAYNALLSDCNKDLLQFWVRLTKLPVVVKAIKGLKAKCRANLNGIIDNKWSLN